MSWTDYPALGERCYYLTLPNGLAVRVLPKPGFAEKFAFLGTNFGSDDVCFTWNGERHTVPVLKNNGSKSPTFSRNPP